MTSTKVADTEPALDPPRTLRWPRFFARSAAPRQRARIPRSTIALLSISIVLPGMLFGLAAYQNWRDIESGMEHHVERTTRILHEHALKIFETQQLVLDQVNERQKNMDWSSAADRTRLHELLEHLRLVLPQVVNIIITDDTGHIKIDALNRPIDPSVTVDDRDYFKALKASDMKLPFISQSSIGKLTDLPVFNIATRAQGAVPGRFYGIVSVALDPAYFNDFYHDLEHGFSQSVVLVREDGSILASDPPNEQTRLPPGSLFGKQLGDRAVSEIIRPSIVDGKMRMFGFEKVGAYPVLIGFSVSRESAMLPWWRNMVGYGLVAGLASLLLLAVSAFAIRRIRLEGRATESWRRTAALLQREIAQRAKVEEQLRQSQKMEAVGQLTGGIAHDFNNLLTVVIGNLDMVSRRMPDATAAQQTMVRNAIDAAQRAAGLTSRLLAFSRQQPLDAKPINANHLIKGMTNLLGRTLGEAVSIELRLSGDLWSTLADPNQLENAILNLCVNSVDAMPRGGQLTIATDNTVLDAQFCEATEDLKPGCYVVVSVSDTGTGMSDEVIERAFEPFFTTKPVGKGTGLGLSQIYGFARQSRGHAKIFSQPDRGTTVSIYLPRSIEVDNSVSPETTAPTRDDFHADGRLILIVEDDDLVRTFSSGALREAGFTVLEAATGSDGLRQIQAHPLVDLLFTDVVLKGPMNGRELAERAKALRPDLPVLFTTGYTNDTILSEGRLADGINMLDKPFTAAALTARIGELLAGTCSPTQNSAVA